MAALAAVKKSGFAIAEGRGEGAMRVQGQFVLDKVFLVERWKEAHPPVKQWEEVHLPV